MAAALGGGEKNKEKNKDHEKEKVKSDVSESEEKSKPKAESPPAVAPTTFTKVRNASASVSRRSSILDFGSSKNSTTDLGSDSRKFQEPAKKVVIPESSTQTTIMAGQDLDSSTSPKEPGKVSSWLKKFSRRASRTIKPEDLPSKNSKSTDSTPKPIAEEEGEKASPALAANLPASQAKGGPVANTSSREDSPSKTGFLGFGHPGGLMMEAPHEQKSSGNPAPASQSSAVSPVEADAAIAKNEFTDPETGPIIMDPITNLPVDTSKSHSGFGTDNIPHIQSSSHLNSSERDVALAGKQPAPQRSRSTSISSLSSDEDTTSRGRSGYEGREGRRDGERKVSMATDISGSEEFEEARDNFEQERLPLPVFGEGSVRGRDSPVRSTRFKEDL